MAAEQHRMNGGVGVPAPDDGPGDAGTYAMRDALAQVMAAEREGR